MNVKNKSVIVFGELQLNNSEVSLFEKGINYCPQKILNFPLVVQSCAQISRKVRLSNYHNLKDRIIPQDGETEIPIITCSNPNTDIVNSNNPMLESTISEMINILSSSNNFEPCHKSEEEKACVEISDKNSKSKILRYQI